MSTTSFTRRRANRSIAALVILFFAAAVLAVSTDMVPVSAFLRSGNSAATIMASTAASASTASIGERVRGFVENLIDPSSTFTVDDAGDSEDSNTGDGVCLDSAGKCTLRAAVQQANADAAADTIVFNLPPNSPLINLNAAITPASIIVSQPVTITGPGARLLAVKGNANTANGVFDVTGAAGGAAGAASISGLTLSNSTGDGIRNAGTLNLSETAITQNQFGINNSGVLRVTRSLIHGNSKSGMLLAAETDANISNTTITNNASPNNGGGINSASGNVTLNNVTISHNSAVLNGGGIYYNNSVDGVFVRNTIVAENSAAAGPDIFSATGAPPAKFISRGHNLIGKSDVDLGFVNATNNDLVGTLAAEVDPLLDALQNNGGPTNTRALLDGSPARDSGNGCVVGGGCGSNEPAENLVNDQRGINFGRLFGSQVDRGAWESFYPTPVISSFSPASAGAGRSQFSLLINGTGFVEDSEVQWEGSDRATTFVSNTQLSVTILAADVASAGDNPVTVINPTPGAGNGTSNPLNFPVVACTYSLSPTSQNFGSVGGNGSINVTAPSGCDWTAVTNVPTWVTINGSASGSGDGSVAFTVASNTGGDRNGTITIGGQTFNITQGSGICTFSISPTSRSVGTALGTGSVSIDASQQSCGWTATVSPSAPWISISGASSGTGDGSVNYAFTANSGPQRSGTITIAGQTFTLTQASGCTYSITPPSRTVSAAGGASSIGVEVSNTSCTWTAVVNGAPWITITSGSSGTSNGTVNISVQPNTGSERVGTLTIAGLTFTLTQESGCTFSISPTSNSAPAGGGPIVVNVTATSGCTWTSAVNPANPWITITSGQNGTGSGTVTLQVAANTGAARQGTVTIAGQTFTVNQAIGCTFSISPTSQSIPATGGTGSVAVTASNAGCSWTAVVNSAPWITITGGSSGTGNGTVSYSVAAHTGPARVGTLTIGGRIFTISQASGCTFTLSPTGTTLPAAGGNGSFTVSTNDQGCTWNAATTSQWITINGGSSGTGNGTVAFTVAANVSPERTGTITVGGQSFTITQSNGCTYSIAPSSGSVPSAGGPGSFNVNSGAGCQWTAVVGANTGWLIITSGSSGAGTGSVTYSAGANPGPQRTGTITVNGRVFTLTQASGCTFSLAPTSASISAAGGNGSVAVTASNAACSWAAVVSPAAPWITVSSGTSGTGNGTVNFVVAASTTPARTGTINIGGSTFTITQANGCVYTLTPASMNINESGGSRSFSIASGVGCPWTAVVGPNSTWITITAGSSGTGNGTVTFSASANTGSERTGTIVAGGQTFTLNQVTLTVTNLNNDGAGSLRKAIANANAAAGDDAIVFQTGLTGQIILTGGEILIANNGKLEIRGPGADKILVSGSNNSRIFYSNAATVLIEGLALTGGNAGGTRSTATNKYGGAIYADTGSMTLRRMSIFGNSFSVPAEPGYSSIGGAVYLYEGANHKIENSSIYGNACSLGAGVYSQGVVAISNSTIYGNTATTSGGGIYALAELSIRNSTISANSVPEGGVGGGMVINGGVISLRNSIIAGNVGPEITLNVGAVLSEGYNLVGDAAGDSTNTVNPIVYQVSDIRDTAPMLSSLQSFGGPTPVAALLGSSPAVNTGNNENAPATDQRGSTRIVSETLDMGAFESNIEVTPAIQMLPSAAQNAFYSTGVTASRIDSSNPDETFAFTIIDGSLPAGLTISNVGTISGTPTGSGAFTFTVKATGADGTSGARRYTLPIGCGYALAPTTQEIAAAGGNGSFSLTTAAGCNWTAATTTPWITITNNPVDPRSGNGQVTFTIQPNTGVARAGTIIAGGQTFTVNQAAGCSVAVSPNSSSVPAAGGNGSVNVLSGVGCAWNAQTTASWLTLTSGVSGTGNGTVNFIAGANTGGARSATITVGTGTVFTVNQPDVNAVDGGVFDFDGDRKTDVGIFRPGPGEWWYLRSSDGDNRAFQFGTTTDKIAPGDYTGDGKTDIAFWRPSTGFWFIIRSEDNLYYGFPFGAEGDIPAPADYDGDGKTDVAVFRPSQATWFILRSSDGGTTITGFGANGDAPVPNDFDGDGKADLAVWRAGPGEWWLLRSSDGQARAVQFGQSTDKAVPGDYTGDGKTDIAFWRPSNGYWYILRSQDDLFYAFPFGANGDVPAPGDYDGDGTHDATVFRPSTVTWYSSRSTAGTMIVGFGASTDVPVSSAYVP
ncbi:MAG: BACON domain-containing carbohydrate-binding protein [Pyrinomonadaceae bacterium]